MHRLYFRFFFSFRFVQSCHHRVERFLCAATLRAGIVGNWSEKSGVTALLRSVLQRIMIERPDSVVSFMIDYFEKLQRKNRYSLTS